MSKVLQFRESDHMRYEELKAAPRNDRRWKLIGGGGLLAVCAAVVMWVGVAWFLIWAGVSGYKYVDGVVNAIKEALR